MGRVIVIGAGIIGLWTTLLLTDLGLGNDIVVIAKCLPGDQSAEYTSPVAGAHYSCDVAGNSKEMLRWCQLSYPLLRELFKRFEGHHEEAGLGRLPQIELFEKPLDARRLNAFKDIVDDFELITDKQWLRERGAEFGMKYTTFNFYSPMFLRFLKKYLEHQGVNFVRATLEHISEAPRMAAIPSPRAVFNCTGVLASKLKGVNDPNKTYPIRGQVVIVRAPWIKENMGLSSESLPPTYIIPRVHSNGRVILGGFYDKGDWTEGTRADQTDSIIARTTRLNPELLKFGPLEILEERAGFRPGREGEARIERQIIGNTVVIHNYGAAGTGYQCGLAMAKDAIALYLNRSSNL